MILCKSPYFKYGRGVRRMPDGIPVSTDLVKNMVPFPCGQCEHCRAAMATKWSNRLNFEAKDYDADKILFVTLTYDDDNLPDGGNLSKSDCTLFLKRLRHYVGKFRYFLVGEYGDKKFRPHVHIILFGISKTCHRTVCVFDAKRCKCPIYKAWKKGRVEVEHIRSLKKGMKYVTGYCFKKRTRRNDEFLKGREPEFKRSSTKPPLGQAYILRRFEKLKRNYGDIYEGSLNTVRQGKKNIPLDRHLKRKVYELYYGSTERLDREFEQFTWENFALSYDPTGETEFHENSIAIKKDSRTKIENNRRKFRKKRRLDNA